METFEGIKQYALEALDVVLPILGKILLGLIILLIAIFIIKRIVKFVKKLLKMAKIEKLDEKLNDIEIAEGKKLNIDSAEIISKCVKWILYFVLIMIGADLLELQVVSDQIKSLIEYFPQLFSALAIFIGGLLFANFIKNSLKSLFESMDMSGGKMLSQVVFFLLLTFISITALNQAGIDTTIISNNINMIIGAFLAAFALGIGLGSRDVINKLLKTFYARKTFEVGQQITFEGEDFEVEAVESIFIVLKNSNRKLMIPINELVESRIELKD